MRLLFKERFFSWLDSYDVYNEMGDVVYSVEGQMAWGHCLKIFDGSDNEIGMIKEEIFSFLPKFDIYYGQRHVGTIRKEFSLFSSEYDIDYMGWHVEGNFWEWDYNIIDHNGNVVATISKELFNWTDTYVIEIGRAHV